MREVVVNGNLFEQIQSHGRQKFHFIIKWWIRIKKKEKSGLLKMHKKACLRQGYHQECSSMKKRRKRLRKRKKKLECIFKKIASKHKKPRKYLILKCCRRILIKTFRKIIKICLNWTQKPQIYRSEKKNKK